MTTSEFTQLGSRYAEDFRALAYRLTRNKEDADDLLQEAAFRAYKNIALYRPGTNFRAWGLTIIRNTFINQVRQQRKRRELLEQRRPSLRWTGLEPVNNLAEAQLGAEEIMRLIEKLSPIYREAIKRYLAGRKYHEIAAELRIPEGTAKSRVATAKAKLRQRILLRSALPATTH